MEILAIINRTPQTVSALSEELNISNSTTSYYLKKLTSAEIVSIEYSIDDLRQKRLTVSQRGKNLLSMYENGVIFHPSLMDDH